MYNNYNEEKGAVNVTLGILETYFYEVFNNGCTNINVWVIVNLYQLCNNQIFIMR